ncbi:MAG: RNA polymerase sigma factor [Myxococcota bacterium]
MASDVALLRGGYRYAMALTHHHRDAEDLVHDAWISAQTRWSKPTRRYLYAAIRHRWIDRMRRLSREVLFDALEPEPSTVTDVEIPIDRIDLEAALGSLKPREREALYLLVVEGWTARDVADLWSSPRGTVLSLVHRAKAKLAETLTKGGEHAHQQP